MIFSNFSGHFDTSGYILPFSVPEISPGDGFVTDRRTDEELGILGVRFSFHRSIERLK